MRKPPGWHILFAYALLGIALFSLGISTSRWAILIPLFVAPGLYPFLGTHFSRFSRFLLHGVLGLLMVALYYAFGLDTSDHFNQNVVFYLGLYPACTVFMRLYDNPSPLWFAFMLFLCGSGLAFAGVDLRPRPYAWFVFAFSVAALLMSLNQTLTVQGLRSRTGKRVGVLVSLALSISLALGIGIPLSRYFPSMQRWLDGIGKPVRGYSDVARIGSPADFASSKSGQDITLRAFSEKEPGSLRASAFVSYKEGAWSAGPDKTVLELSAQPWKRILLRYLLPRRPAPAQDQEAPMRITASALLGNRLFLPLEASAIDTALPDLILLPGRVIESGKSPASAGYGVHVSVQPVMDGLLPESVPSILTSVPENETLVKALDDILARSGTGTSMPVSPDQAVQQISGFLAREFRYDLELRLKPNMDPVVQFLTVEHRGHCELFASAGCLLLRRLGVPARYVNGFVCAEKNPFSDLWVARSRDAHAWVEYRTPEGSWKTAEFTPASGVPGEEETPRWSGLWEWIRAQGQRILTGARDGVLWILRSVRQGFIAFGIWLTGAWYRPLGLVALMILVYTLQRRSRNVRSRRMEALRRFPAGLAAQRERYFQLQRELARSGWGKRDEETLQEYADRLSKSPLPQAEEVVPFLRQFDEARYAPFDEA